VGPSSRLIYLGLLSLFRLVLTITRLKLKRPQTAKKFRTDLDKLYEEALAEEAAGGKMKARL
jgi:long-chain acyl-CoA synthetase